MVVPRLDRTDEMDHFGLVAERFERGQVAVVGL